jgi:penicillin-binding protein 1A
MHKIKQNKTKPKAKGNRVARKIFLSLSILFTLSIIVGFLSSFLFITFIQDIPDYRELAGYQPAGITRLYDSHGNVLDEYANEKRVYVKYKDTPKMIVNAFIAAEDKNFFEHQGIDFISVIRASIQNILNIGKNKRLIGASTITQQVVKGFFFSNEPTLVRKIKEAILAFRINKEFSKEEILEIYLNQTYLGHHSYGVYVAAQNYFGKQLKDINIEEAALLASLPKAPSTMNPYKNYTRALERRNWAIQRMEDEGFISNEESINAKQVPIKLSYSSIRNNKYEDYYTDAVKTELSNLFTAEDLYNQAYVINTNIDLKLQAAATEALRTGLKNFDKKKGWRGAFAKIDLSQPDIAENLKKIANSTYQDNYSLGVITKVNAANLDVILSNGKTIQLNKDSYTWIINANSSVQAQLKKLFKPGDVILIDGVQSQKYKIEQIPAVNGAIVVIENVSGKILSLVGGYDFRQSNFNRVTQAYRQPGSAFKTFVYLSAFEQGISPNTLVLDEPLEVDLGYGLPKWKPKNHGDAYYGLITLRTSFEKSRNLSTLRLVIGIGLDKVVETAEKYLIYNSSIKPTYAMALGAFETTLLKLTNAYASIANNGILKQPKLIDSVYNKDGVLLYSPNDLFCNHCGADEISKSQPEIGFLGKTITDSASNYQILSLLEGVVLRGSAQRAQALNRVVAGKTGTTNNSRDTWFVGMTPDVTVGVFVGYDTPKDMGKHAQGSNVALPIFVDFFQKASFIPNRPFEIPNSVEIRYVDPSSGKILEERDSAWSAAYIGENFKKDSMALDQDEPNSINTTDDVPSTLSNEASSIFDLIQNPSDERIEGTKQEDDVRDIER